MLKLLEDATKQWLAENRFPVPQGHVASSVEDAAAAVGRFKAGAYIKGLVPANRRAKAGIVQFAANSDEGIRTARKMLGLVVDDARIDSVYVEERVDIQTELFLAFELSSDRPHVMLSRRGGVEIEDVAKTEPGALVRAEIDPAKGLMPWEALELWKRAGLSGRQAAELGTFTSKLFSLFQRDDALVLELNPIVLDTQSRVVIVGALAAIDENAVERHERWKSLNQANLASSVGISNERERRVAEANLSISGGECRYVECDGDIGLLVGGGGAGLYQHDRLLAIGGRPANHCVTPPTSKDPSKLIAVIEAILDNPRIRGLLVGFNFAQMARVDIRAKAVVDVIRRRNIDLDEFPIVLRLFGPGEEAARALASTVPGLHYLDRDASLDDGVELIARLVRRNEERITDEHHH